MKRFPFAHENLGPAGDRKDRGQVPRELAAIGNNISSTAAGRIVSEPDRDRRRPKAIGLTEAIGYDLPGLARYGDPIRSTKTEGRANIALYLRNGLEGPPPQWIQHKETWDRTERAGVHPARATLVKELHHGPTVVVGHGPPVTRSGPGSSRDARAEWVEATTAILWQYGQVVWLGDPNGLLVDVLHALKDPKAAIGGTATDAVLVRGYTIESASTPGSVNGVPMLTDHRKALLGLATLR